MRNKKNDNQFQNIDVSRLSKQELEALNVSKVAELRNNDTKLVEDQEREKKAEERQKKIRRILQIATVVLFILLLVARCSSVIRDKNIVDIGVSIDSINPSDLIYPDEKELESRKAELVISMNKTSDFENGLAVGELNIENDPRNMYMFFIEIFLNNENGEPTDTKIYQSDMIPIGQFVIKDKLDVNLPEGIYDCTAFFNAVASTNKETGAEYRLTVDEEGNVCNIIEAGMTVENYYKYLENGINLTVLSLSDALTNAGISELPIDKSKLDSELLNEVITITFKEIIPGGWEVVNNSFVDKSGAKIKIVVKNTVEG